MCSLLLFCNGKTKNYHIHGMFVLSLPMRCFAPWHHEQHSTKVSEWRSSYSPHIQSAIKQVGQLNTIAASLGFGFQSFIFYNFNIWKTKSNYQHFISDLWFWASASVGPRKHYLCYFLVWNKRASFNKRLLLCRQNSYDTL